MDSLQANDDDRYRMCRHLLKGSAFTFLYTAQATNWTSLRSALLARFHRQVSYFEVYDQLRVRHRKPNETTMQYITEMQFIAAKASVPDSDLIPLIIAGMRGHSQYVATFAGIRTLADLFGHIPSYDRLVSADLAMGPSGQSASTSAQPPRRPSANQSATQSAGTSKQEVTCYNCNGKGHYSAECTRPRRPIGSCFTCGSMKHKNPDCPIRKKMVGAVCGPPQNNDGNQEPKPDEDDNDEEMARGLGNLDWVSVSFNDSIDEGTHFNSIRPLFDSGSPTSFIRRSVLPSDFRLDKASKSDYNSLNQNPIYIYGKTNCFLRLYGFVRLISVFIVSDHTMPYDILIGRDTLATFHISLQINIAALIQENNTAMSLKNINKELSLKIKKKLCTSVSAVCSSRLCAFSTYLANYENNTNTGNSVDSSIILAPPDALHTIDDTSNTFDSSVLAIDTSCNSDSTYDIDPLLGNSVSDSIRQLILDNYVNIDPSDVCIPDYELHIHLENEVPFYTHPRRLSVAEKMAVREILKDLLDKEIIRPSESPYACPLVLVPKKNGEKRMCIDYKALNKLMIRDNYPLPLVDDCLEYLSNKKVFSLLDLKSGFHHVKVAPNSVKYTAFVTPEGQFEYLRMPFGLKNGPAVFQRYINKILKPFIDSGKIMVYMDDIMVATKTLDEHTTLLAELLRCIATNGLQLQLGKCQFAYSTVNYLGFVVSADGIKPGNEKLRAIQLFPVPISTKNVHSFIGLCSFFRRFISGFSQIASPLYRLLQKDAVFDFSEECHKAFNHLKKLLTSAPVLAIYDSTKITELHTDASKIGFGAAIMQKQNDNKFHPVAYFSKTIGKHEINYHSFELETLAIVYALERFRVYLEGIPFTIVTDCNSLVASFNKRDVNPRIARWMFEFARYNYEVRHRHGNKMGHVDALSRNPVIAFVDTSEVDFQLRLTQNRDPVIAQLKDTLTTIDSTVYEMIDGIVYKRGRDGRRLFFVPQEMEQPLIRQVHERLGHFSLDKCYERIKARYWFPGMKDKIDTFIKNCIKCIMHSAQPKPSERSLYSIPKKPIPFDTIHLDHFGPLPSVISKKKHLLVIVDAFTKYVRLYPVNSTSTKEVCCALEKYFEYYSRPTRIVSDRGTCFTSSDFMSFTETHNIQHVKVAVASPQANGQVERVNRVLKNMLGKLTEPTQNADWTKKLREVEYALNNTVSRSIGTTPSKLLFGVEQKGPEVDLLSEYLDDQDLSTEIRDLTVLRDQASACILKSQEYSQKWWEQHCTSAKTYNTGDFIVIRHVDTSVGHNKKFLPRFRGPYIIHKVLPHDRYVIRDVEGCQITQMPYNGIVEAKNLRLWKSIESATAPIETPNPSSP